MTIVPTLLPTGEGRKSVKETQKSGKKKLNLGGSIEKFAKVNKINY